MDLEPSVCEQIRNTRLKTLFDPEKTVYAAEDGANVYARGKYVASRQIAGPCVNEIRKSIESCNNIQSIKCVNASGGGSNKEKMNLLDVFFC